MKFIMGMFIALSVCCLGQPSFNPEKVHLRLGGHLEDDSFFHKVADIEITEDAIYILDRGRCQVFRFDLAGNHLATFGGKGQGPGELNDPRDMAFFEGRLWVSDFGNGRIQAFKNNVYHQMIKLTKPAMPKNLEVIGSELIAAPQALIADFGGLVSLDASGDVLREIGSIDVPADRWGQTTSLWRMFDLIPLGNDRLAYGFTFDNLLMVTDLDGKILKAQQMDSIYERYEDRRGNVTYPAGYAAMTFAEGPNDTILLASCNQEMRTCSTVYQVDAATLQPVNRWDFGETVRAMHYDAKSELLFVAHQSEVLAYGADRRPAASPTSVAAR